MIKEQQQFRDHAKLLGLEVNTNPGMDMHTFTSIRQVIACVLVPNEPNHMMIGFTFYPDQNVRMVSVKWFICGKETGHRIPLARFLQLTKENIDFMKTAVGDAHRQYKAMRDSLRLIPANTKHHILIVLDDVGTTV